MTGCLYIPTISSQLSRRTTIPPPHPPKKKKLHSTSKRLLKMLRQASLTAYFTSTESEKMSLP